MRASMCACMRVCVQKSSSLPSYSSQKTMGVGETPTTSPKLPLHSHSGPNIVGPNIVGPNIVGPTHRGSNTSWVQHIVITGKREMKFIRWIHPPTPSKMILEWGRCGKVDGLVNTVELPCVYIKSTGVLGKINDGERTYFSAYRVRCHIHTIPLHRSFLFLCLSHVARRYTGRVTRLILL